MKPDETHDPSLQSWVASANGHEQFPIQNLPLGVFQPASGAPRIGVAIGDQILDLRGLLQSGVTPADLSDIPPEMAGDDLGAFFALAAPRRRALRASLSRLLRADRGAVSEPHLRPHLHEARACRMALPARIGDFSDFYAGIHHAINAGRQFRPDQPLLPNYKHVPIAYHGRSSSIGVSGMTLRRPMGQVTGREGETPTLAPSVRLDFELELGVWLAGGNELGHAIPISQAPDHAAGYCLLNDWSARDIQAWEYRPLGPFLAKSFASTVSPWVVTQEALIPFRVAQPPRPEGDPAPLPYLTDPKDQAAGALNIELELYLKTAQMAGDGPGDRITRTNARQLYWTVAQMIAHHTVNGCNLRPGDLFGTGTISSQTRDGFGSLLEITEGGRTPLDLSTGETRCFLEDGDTVTIRARASGAGYVPIGFGECHATVTAAST